MVHQKQKAVTAEVGVCSRSEEPAQALVPNGCELSFDRMLKVILLHSTPQCCRIRMAVDCDARHEANSAVTLFFGDKHKRPRSGISNR